LQSAALVDHGKLSAIAAASVTNKSCERTFCRHLGDFKLQDIDSVEIDKLYISLEGKIAPRKTPSAGESDHGVALDDEQLRKLVRGFKDNQLYAIVSVAAFTGMRRNEILALRWSDLDAAKKTLRIERALEETKQHGIRFKGPKRESHKRTITIDDDLLALLLAERDKHLRLIAGIPEGAPVDLGLIKLPDGALMFPNLIGGDLTTPRFTRQTSTTFIRKASKLGFKGLRFHDLRGTHETLLLDNGVPVHVLADRCGHDPAMLLRTYAKRTHKADKSAATVIGSISKGILGG